MKNDNATKTPSEGGVYFFRGYCFGSVRKGGGGSKQSRASPLTGNYKPGVDE